MAINTPIQMWVAAGMLLACAMQGQQLPSAPAPKPTPAPFKLPSRAQAPQLLQPGNKKGADDEDLGSLGVSKEVLHGPQEFLIKDFLKNRLRPTIMQRWDDVMPEEAKEHRTGLIRAVKKGKNGTVRVAFTLHKNGQITDISLADSSGDKLLDQAAIKAVKDSQPLSLPKAFAKDQLRIRATFLYNPKRHP